MAETELRDCKITQQQIYVCKQHHPIYNRQSSQSRCEVCLMNHEKVLEKSCLIHKMEPSKLWIQLHNPNTWIYVFDQEYILNIICDKLPLEEKLSGSGILHLESNCIIKQSTMSIMAHNIYPTQLMTSITPFTNFKEIFKQQDLDEISFKKGPSSIDANSNDDFTQLQEALNIQKQQENSQLQLSVHDVHHYSMIYGFIGIMLLLWIISIIKKRRTLRIDHSNYVI